MSAGGGYCSYNMLLDTAAALLGSVEKNIHYSSHQVHDATLAIWKG